MSFSSQPGNTQQVKIHEKWSYNIRYTAVCCAHTYTERKQEVVPNGHEGETIQKSMKTKQNLNGKPFFCMCLIKKETQNLQNKIFQVIFKSYD